MKINAPATRTLAAALLLLVSVAFDAPAQNRPAPPTPSTIRRPSATPAGAAPRAATQPSGGGAIPVIPVDDSPNALNYQDASIYLVIMDYAMRKGLTPIFAPGISPDTKVTLRSVAECPLDDEQYLMAIEQVLNLNDIVLEPKGDKFLQVVKASELRKFAPPTLFPDPETGALTFNPENGQFVSQVLEFVHINAEDVSKLITHFGSKYVQSQEINSRSILLTDSADNVNRIIEMLSYIDKPMVSREQTEYIRLVYAEPDEMKSIIQEMFDSAKNKEKDKKGTTMPQDRSTGAPGMERRTLPPGVTLPGRREPDPASAKTPAALEAIIAESQRSVLLSDIVLISDKRTKTLIVITNPEAMAFIKDVVKRLDTPATLEKEIFVEVHRLEHADAKEVAEILNQLIENKAKAEKENKPAPGSTSPAGSDAADAAPRQTSTSPRASTGSTKLGDLDPEKIVILADERTNALIIKAPRDDMATIREIIVNMDIMLSQVVIETVIVSLNFKDEAQTGIDWVQRAMMAGTSDKGDGPAIAFASAGGGGSLTPAHALSKTMTESMGYGGGATFVGTFFDFNLDIIIQAVATDARARLVNTPIITTLDNKEAILESTERIYYTEGTTYYSNSDNSTKNIKNEDIGVKLKVTPRINKKGYIVLTIEQEWQDLGSGQMIDGENLPTVNTRKMGSDVAVQSGQTVVLGGLASNSEIASNSKIPLLGDIPLLGWFFRSSVRTKNRNEIVIFLTPRVIDTPGQIEDEARSRKAVLDTDGIWNSGWSNSRLADPISESDERKLIERGRETIAPPRYPLTRHLTELNREHGLKPEVAPTNRLGSRYDYSHFSDIPIDEDRMVSAETPAPATAEPATAPEAPAPAEPATTPEAQVPAEAPASPAPAVSPDASPPRLATPPEPATAPEAPAAAEPAAEAPASAIDQRIQDILGQ